MIHKFIKEFALSFSVCCLVAPIARAANNYTVHNLVSDIPGLADQTDSKLSNPWGIAASPASPLWISDNHSGNATVYDGAGNAVPAGSALVVPVPPPANGKPPAAPTGMVFNDTAGFTVAGQPASFLFSTEDGTISAWNSSVGGAGAMLVADNSGSGAVYKGLALAATSSGSLLYAANFNSGAIDVFDTNFNSVAVAGGFSDPNLPQGFAPFNIQRLARKLYVTYARQDAAKHDDVSGPGNGFVDVFDFSGNLLQRLISNGQLNSPWGLALSPNDFGDFSNALLVGNFGDGTVNAFDSCSGAYLGALQDPSGNPISIPGLWGLMFGTGKQNTDPNALLFTAGIPGGGNIEDHGLLGSIKVGDGTTQSQSPGVTPTRVGNPVPQPPAPQPVTPPPPAQPYAVGIDNFMFSPSPITVPAGAQVVWTNRQGLSHTVVADKNQFSSNILDQGQTFTFNVASPGTYTYHCSIHPFMKGTVVAQ